MLSDRINKIKESGIRKVFELAAKNKGEYINLSIGQPHFKVPEKLKHAARSAIIDDQNAYAPTRGLPKLVENIKNKLKKENGINSDKGEVIVTSGVSGGIFLLLSSIIDPGDEVILTDPYFVLYHEVLLFLGAEIKYLDTYPSFHIDPARLEKLISSKTKALILNSPNNPTGAVYERRELENIAHIAEKNNLLVISDEIYEKFDYDKKFFSIGSIYDKTVTLNGYSKSHSITGWRVGYAHGPGEIIGGMGKLQMYTFVCAPSFAQAALAQEEDYGLEADYKGYLAKRDYVYGQLNDCYQLNKPEGAFYAFIKIPEGRPGFMDELMMNKLLVVPGSSFSGRDDHFRVSFAVDDAILEKGISILKKMA